MSKIEETVILFTFRIGCYTCAHTTVEYNLAQAAKMALVVSDFSH